MTAPTVSPITASDVLSITPTASCLHHRLSTDLLGRLDTERPRKATRCSHTPPGTFSSEEEKDHPHACSTVKK